MPNQNRFARRRTIELPSIEDSDELQLLDECDSHWVEAWKTASNSLAEFTVHVIHPLKHARA